MADTPLPSDLLGPAVLLLLAERPSHGYGLVDRLKLMGWADSSTGALYRELRRLEEAGCVHSWWEASQTRGPARRVYELTHAGRAALDGHADAAAGLQRYLDEWSERYRQVVTRRRRLVRPSP